MNENTNITCKETQERLPDLLLDPAAVPAAVEAHVADCTGCRSELGSLIATFEALDAWTAPEPSPYFDTRMHARIREAQSAGLYPQDDALIRRLDALTTPSLDEAQPEPVPA